MLVHAQDKLRNNQANAQAFARDNRISLIEPPGKSVLPIPSLNNVSPVKTSFSPTRHMLPGVCPGVSITVKDTSPNLIKLPSSKQYRRRKLILFQFLK